MENNYDSRTIEGAHQTSEKHIDVANQFLPSARLSIAQSEDIKGTTETNRKEADYFLNVNQTSI
jgi:hypothetical protein